MKISKKIIIIAVAVLVLLIGVVVVYASNTPIARAERQLNLGNKYLHDGKYQEAILAFKKVIEIEPKNIPARLGLGQVYVATKEFTKAETVLKEVIGIDKNNIPAREDLFKVYLKEGNLDAADAILQEITMIDTNKDVMRLSSDLDSAKTINASKASYDLGIKQMSDQLYLEAVDSFRKVIKEDTERYADAQSKISDSNKSYIDGTLQKAKDAASTKDYKSALNYLEQVLKIDQNNQEALKLKSEYTKILVERKPLIGEEYTLNGFKLGAHEDNVISKFGSPINRVIDNSSQNYKTINLNYNFGKVSLFSRDSYEPWAFIIQINTRGIYGPRETQVGDSVESLLEKFPDNHYPIQSDGTLTYRELYKIGQLYSDDYNYGILTYGKNNEISEVSFSIGWQSQGFDFIIKDSKVSEILLTSATD